MTKGDKVSFTHQLRRTCGLVVRGPEVREQHQTERPSQTGLELYAGSDYAIFMCSFLREHGT